MEAQSEELYKKCQENAGSGDIMGACKVMLELMEAKNWKSKKRKIKPTLKWLKTLNRKMYGKCWRWHLKLEKADKLKILNLKTQQVY